MKTFKEFTRELPESEYSGSWQKVKRGASEIGSGAVEAGKTFVKRDLPVLVKKGEQAYQKAKPVVAKAVGVAGGAVEQGGRAVRQWANEDLEEILLFILDESVEEEIRLEIFESVFGVLNEGKNIDTAMDAAKSWLDTITFGQGKKAIAWGMSKVKGTDYQTELEKEQKRMEQGEKRSPIATKMGRLGAGDVFAGYDLGKELSKNKNVQKAVDPTAKRIARSIDDTPEVNRAIKRPADYVPQRIKDQQQQNDKPPLGPVNIKPKVPETKSEQKPVSGDQSSAKPKQDFRSKESIMNMQRELNKRGANLKVDGIVGKRTASSVRNLQSDLNKKGAGLKIDGDYGEKTHAALNSQLTNKPKTLPNTDKPKYGPALLPNKLDPNKPKYGPALLPNKLDPNKPKGSEIMKLGKDDGMMPKSLPKTQYKDDGMMPTKKDNANASPFMKKKNYL